MPPKKAVTNTNKDQDQEKESGNNIVTSASTKKSKGNKIDPKSFNTKSKNKDAIKKKRKKKLASKNKDFNEEVEPVAGPSTAEDYKVDDRTPKKDSKAAIQKVEVEKKYDSSSKCEDNKPITITEKYLGEVGAAMIPQLRSAIVNSINAKLAKLDPETLKNKKSRKKMLRKVKEMVYEGMISKTFVNMYNNLQNLVDINRSLMIAYDNDLKTLSENSPKVELVIKCIASKTEFW